MDIRQIQKEAYKIATEQGFYENEINIETAITLVIAEMGELINAYNHLHYADRREYEREQSRKWFKPTFEKSFERHIKNSVEDEFSDIIILVASLAENKGVDLTEQLEKPWYRNFSNYSFVENANRFMRNAIKTHHAKNDRITVAEKLKFLYLFAREWALHCGVDIEYFVPLKMKYNETRGYLHLD